ncbi:MAG: hypothetical protein J2P54_09885 [Bradyrhizobiaceae bacterium]|nr:hypothetical protein [Bradyrhizobiaceae bacterium]
MSNSNIFFGVVDNPGILSGHPDMPEFVFDGADVGAIIAYLKVIQE